MQRVATAVSPPAGGPGPAPWSVFCDGSAPPRSSRLGLGAVLYPPGGGAPQRLSEAVSPTSGGCNNEAELRALALALRWLHALPQCAGRAALVIHSDSRVLVDQLRSRAGAPPPRPIARLAGLTDAILALLAPFESVDLRWIPRHRNGDADALARAALALPPKPAATPHALAEGKRRRMQKRMRKQKKD